MKRLAGSYGTLALHLHAVGDFCTFYGKTVGAMQMEMRGISSYEKSVWM